MFSRSCREGKVNIFFTKQTCFTEKHDKLLALLLTLKLTLLCYIYAYKISNAGTKVCLKYNKILKTIFKVQQTNCFNTETIRKRFNQRQQKALFFYDYVIKSQEIY